MPYCSSSHAAWPIISTTGRIRIMRNCILHTARRAPAADPRIAPTANPYSKRRRPATPAVSPPLTHARHTRREHTRRTMPRVSPAVVLALSAMCAVAAACSGKESFVLTVEGTWARSAGDFFRPEKVSFPVIIAVSHTSEFQLFTQGEKISDEAAGILSFDTKPMFRALEDAKDKGLVGSWDEITDMGPTEKGKMQLDFDGDKGITEISLMGALAPSPKWFMGLMQPFKLCESDQPKFPTTSAKALQLEGIKSGLDDGEGWTERKPLNGNDVKEVDQIRAVGVPESFGLLTYKRGKLRRFDVWKLLVGLGVAACLALIAFFCIYPRCCRKRQAVVPMTEQHDIEW